jgi:protein-S-isoprenylcysteine O-methyltransferase Ste14
MGPQMAVHRTHAGQSLDHSVVAGLKGSLAAFRGTKAYDLLAAAPLIAWYGFCLAHQLPALARQIAQTDFAAADVRLLAGLASKIATAIFFIVLAVLLALRRTPRAKTAGLYPRFAAVAGTYLGGGIVLLPPRELSAALSLLSTSSVLCGTVFAIYAALSLGRSLSMLPEARRLVTRGPYRLVRHPLYVSEALALVGVTLQYLSPLALTLLVFQCIFQLERMTNEERVLARTFPEYRDYMAATARLVPGVY